MKRLFHFGVVFMTTWPLLLFSQATPMFEMPIYFADAQGNLDTLVIGYDDLAWNVYNPTYDGAEITEPFDSVFEVRAAHYEDNWADGFQWSDRIVGSYDPFFGSPCGVSEGILIVVSCKYPPLTIFYDSTRLSHPDSCRTSTILSRDWGIFQLQYWWDADDWHCMSKTDKIVADLQHHIYSNSDALTVNAEVEGQGEVALPAFFMKFRNWGPCTDSTILDAKPPDKAPVSRVFPNPCASGELATLEFSALANEEGIVSLYPTGGVLVRRTEYSAGQERVLLPTAGLSPGWYAVLLRDREGRIVGAARMGVY